MEHVLVTPTARLHELGYFQGFTADTERYVKPLLQPEHLSYRPRDAMEQDPAYKQLIPYVVFRCKTDQGVLLFQYTRGSGQGEARLHAKRSIGIGGHISADDALENSTSADVYDAGMKRELQEEVAIETPYTQHCAGLINDDESEVGRVHLGIVHIFDVEQPAVTAREDDIANAGFLPVAQIIAGSDKFETWSQICLKALFAAPAAG